MKREWVVSSENHQMRIDDFAYSHHISKKALKDIKFAGDILVDGIHRTVRYQLQEGEKVTFVFPKEVNNIPPENIPINIVYEDDYIIVLDKEPLMACIPTRSHPCHTLANALSYYYQVIGLDSTIHIVNRLDRETSGLMMIAKYRYIHDMMSKKHIFRLYHAHVHGYVKQGMINLPIYKEDQQMKRVIDKRGKTSITYYKGLKYKDGISLVKCRLETGRTHQIRIHMSSIGHPLVGDSLYGDGKGIFDLTSCCIAFVHPITNQVISITKNIKS